MGVSGSGKTTIGKALAAELGWQFVDGDDLHPAANVAKMALAIPLNDEDRKPWLLQIRRLIQEEEGGGRSMVVACSALKQVYREFLNEGTHIRWVFLDGPATVIRERLKRRNHPFMKSELLGSQLEALEAPGNALVVNIVPPVEDVVRKIRDGLGLGQ